MCVGLVLVESDQNLISLCRVLVWFTTTETLICPGWETSVVPVSQPETPGRDKRGCPFVPGLATRNTNRDKRCCQRLFSIPLFSIVFLFPLYFYISIKLMYWNSVRKISTNIYIYIVTYIIFVLNSFHIYIYIDIIGGLKYIIHTYS